MGASCRLHPTRRPSGGPEAGFLGQGVGAVQQGCARLEHVFDGFQVLVALLRMRDGPHLVVVAIFQHDHGDGDSQDPGILDASARSPLLQV